MDTTRTKIGQPALPLRRNTKPVIVSNEDHLLSLFGDFTEAVKLTYEYGGPHFLNGWYVYERTPDGNNRFIRKREEIGMIEVVSCATRYLQFDETEGLLPSQLHAHYQQVGPLDPEFERLKSKLTEAGEWNEGPAPVRCEFSPTKVCVKDSTLR